MATTQDVDATIQFRMNSTIKDGAFAVLRTLKQEIPWRL